MMSSSASLLEAMVRAKSRWSSFIDVSSSSVVMPITAFSGVRISWLMLARNRLLARVAASASERARSSSIALPASSRAAARALLTSRTIAVK